LELVVEGDIMVEVLVVLKVVEDLQDEVVHRSSLDTQEQ
jgi:hypothetical protein